MVAMSAGLLQLPGTYRPAASHTAHRLHRLVELLFAFLDTRLHLPLCRVAKHPRLLRLLRLLRLERL